MKKIIIIISCFIMLLLDCLIILYKNRVRYTLEIDGVKLALTLDNNSISYFPKDNDYHVDITCSHVIGEYFYDTDEETFKLTFKNIESGAKCKLDFTSSLDTLIDIVEDVAQFEDNIPSDFTKVTQSGYSGSAPVSQFYLTDMSTSATTGTSDSDATLTFDTTNNMWVTGNLTHTRYYYYFFNMSSAGNYKFCYSHNSGSGNYLYVLNGTSNLIDNSNYIVASRSGEKCISIGEVSTTDVIKVVQYTTSTNVSSINFGFKKSNSTTDAGYRYEGNNPNNYVWFNNQLWRIIGSIPTKIDSGGSTTTINLVKIIKAEPIGALVRNTANPTPNWSSTSLYTLLNNYYYGAQNATGTSYCYDYYTTSKAKCDYRYAGIETNGYYGTMIKEVYWNTGMSQINITPTDVYSDEVSEQSDKGKIGLMNISDFGLASSHNRLSRAKMKSYTTHTPYDWLYGVGSEHTIDYSVFTSNTAIYIISGGYALIYDINNGYSNYSTMNFGYAVRPVVYLDPSLYVVSGDGSQATPYKIAWPSSS